VRSSTGTDATACCVPALRLAPFDLKYVALGGAFNFPTGFFKERSQLAMRVTYLLN
jgi:hypothetical protein